MIAHDDSKELKCNICSKVFSSKFNLRRHIRTHTGEKPFACKVCDKKFALKCYLTLHEAIHSEVKPFKCTICPDPRFFKTKSGLNHHMVYHYEPKYSCRFCSHKSYRKHNLKIHESTHVKK